MTQCPRCKYERLVTGIMGGWFILVVNETVQIAYCPRCGVLLDPAGEWKPKRKRARLKK